MGYLPFRYGCTFVMVNKIKDEGEGGGEGGCEGRGHLCYVMLLLYYYNERRIRIDCDLCDMWNVLVMDLMWKMVTECVVKFDVENYGYKNPVSLKITAMEYMQNVHRQSS